MGKLNIAHHKSYHPYRRGNTERDEEEANLKESQEDGHARRIYYSMCHAVTVTGSCCPASSITIFALRCYSTKGQLLDVILVVHCGQC